MHYPLLFPLGEAFTAPANLGNVLVSLGLKCLLPDGSYACQILKSLRWIKNSSYSCVLQACDGLSILNMCTFKNTF